MIYNSFEFYILMKKIIYILMKEIISSDLSLNFDSIVECNENT